MTDENKLGEILAQGRETESAMQQRLAQAEKDYDTPDPELLEEARNAGLMSQAALASFD